MGVPPVPALLGPDISSIDLIALHCPLPYDLTMLRTKGDGLKVDTFCFNSHTVVSRTETPFTTTNRIEFPVFAIIFRTIERELVQIRLSWSSLTKFFLIGMLLEPGFVKFPLGYSYTFD